MTETLFIKSLAALDVKDVGDTFVNSLLVNDPEAKEQEDDNDNEDDNDVGKDDVLVRLDVRGIREESVADVDVRIDCVVVRGVVVRDVISDAPEVEANIGALFATAAVFVE